MSVSTRIAGSVEPDVLAYYERNWKRIVQCYDLDADGLPIDPAWYRRRLYNEFLDRERPTRVLDVGCGGGQTVLDAYRRGLTCHGVEPVGPLRDAARKLLHDNGVDDSNIHDGDLSTIGVDARAAYDCVSLLSVLPAIPFSEWNTAHRAITANVRPGGYFIAAYRNHLFDLYTFNSFTVEFYGTALWETAAAAPLRTDRVVGALKGLVTHPDVPGPFHTDSPDKSFGRLERPKSNPLTLPAYLRTFGLQVERLRFCHFHCVPPLLQDEVADFRRINHEMELTLADDWRGHIMAAMVFVEARKL
jgi:SAM-dependent methyltransferase